MKIAQDDTVNSASRRQLTLIDTTSIVVGIVIGASIFRSPQLIALNTGGVGLYFLAWTLGGAISLLGSLCFAELATRYPEHGGAYAYLHRAFGGRASFFFAWTDFWLVRPGNIGAMAFIFAPAFCSAIGREWSYLYVALGVVGAVTLLNLLGLRFGIWGQNLFTAAKVMGLVLVILIGLGGAAGIFSSPSNGEGDGKAIVVRPAEAASHTATNPVTKPVTKPEPPKTFMVRFASFWQAMVFVMFAYGGWSDMAMVSAEVREPRKNLFRALLLGAGAVTAIYLLTNVAYLLALGFGGILAADSPAKEVMSGAFGNVAGRIMSGLICISCIGAIQGLIFTGARVQIAVGRDHRFFAWLGTWNALTQAPLRALIAQFIAVVLLLFAAWFRASGDSGGTKDSFDQMVIYTGFVYWGSLLAVAAAMMVLRDRDGHAGGFRTPWFPLLSFLFMATMAAMVYATMRFALFVKLESGEGVGWFIMALVVFASGVLLGGFGRQSASGQKY
jgi:basic amino acid/polyamine antiporter, APA family